MSQMNEKKLSIIVPVYNIEHYIRECIESILSQTFNNYELIIVDDGSTDSSGRICDSYDHLKNVRVFHKDNGGLSSARNYGIKMSSGQYLMFIDGDDYLFEKTSLAKIVKKINSGKYDVVQYRIAQYYEKTKKYAYQSDIKEYNESIIFNKLRKMNIDGNFSISACDKIVRREILFNNNLFFDEGLLSEDIDWSLRLYQYINDMAILNSTIYVYRQQRKGSITSSKSKIRCDSLFSIIKNWYHYDYRDDTMKQLYLSFLAYQYLILLAISGNKKEYREYRSILKNDDNYKVKMFNKMCKRIGFSASLLSIKVYLWLKNKGVVKL